MNATLTYTLGSGHAGNARIRSHRAAIGWRGSWRSAAAADRLALQGATASADASSNETFRRRGGGRLNTSTLSPAAPAAIVPASSASAIATLANQYAASALFSDYTQRKSANTLRRHANDLASFAVYLRTIKLPASERALMNGPDAWRGMTWGVISGYVKWMLNEGYAVATANARLSTVKVYAGLAFQAGALSAEEHALIRNVKGYQSKEIKRVDEQRIAAGGETRIGAKKAEAVVVPDAVRKALKSGQPDTAQGRRDAVILCLLLDHGLRCGELAGLQVADVNLTAGELRFYRSKVDKTQTHKLTRDALAALRAWFESGHAPIVGPLLRSSRKGGELTDAGMSERAITKRVEYLGRRHGIVGLSAHDMRHSWATTAVRKGTDAFKLKDAGGWSSMTTVSRYVAASAIANDGVHVD